MTISGVFLITDDVKNLYTKQSVSAKRRDIVNRMSRIV